MDQQSFENGFFFGIIVANGCGSKVDASIMVDRLREMSARTFTPYESPFDAIAKWQHEHGQEMTDEMKDDWTFSPKRHSTDQLEAMADIILAAIGLKKKK